MYSNLVIRRVQLGGPCEAPAQESGGKEGVGISQLHALHISSVLRLSRLCFNHMGEHRKKPYQSEVIYVWFSWHFPKGRLRHDTS
jgi:hypothetical protein